MLSLPSSIILTVAVLTGFLVLLVVLKYAVEDDFNRTRLTMTAFFAFIVATLTICFKEYFFATLPFTIPAGFFGVLAGYFVGLPAAEARLQREGLARYRNNFTEIEAKGVRGFKWWNVLNFYTILSALALINLVGLTTVLLNNLEPMALATSAFGAFLIGTIIPYLCHLWSIRSKGAAR